MIPASLSIVCPRCKAIDAMKFSEWPGPCKKCKESKEYKAEVAKKVREAEKITVSNHNYHKYPDITHFVKDKRTGKSLAVDVKGNYHDPTKTHYDIHHDPHGWRSSGLKVKEDR